MSTMVGNTLFEQFGRDMHRKMKSLNNEGHSSNAIMLDNRRVFDGEASRVKEL